MGLEKAANKKCTPTKVKNCLKTFLVHLFSHVGLCVLVVGYAVIGGFIFRELEQKTDDQWKKLKDSNDTELNKARRQSVSNLWNITDRLNVLYEKDWKIEVEAELEQFERKVKAGTKPDRITWTFTSALLYSVSIITTIGYGHIHPETMEGKLFTVFYAVIGVPIMLLWVSNIGNVMAHAFKFAYFHSPCYGGGQSNRNKKTVQSQQRRSKKDVATKRKQPIPPPSDDPCPTQIEFSISNEKCETVLLKEPGSSPTLSYPRSPPSKRGQVTRRSLQNLDPTARQILFECAEYNLSQGDEPSRELILQLGSSSPFDRDEVDDGSKMSSDVESVIDLGSDGHGRFRVPSMIPPPPKFDESGGSVYGFNGTLARKGSSRRVSMDMSHGTPSRVPLLAERSSVDIERVDIDNDDAGDQRSCEFIEKRVPVSLVFLVVVLYIVLGAAVFASQEDGWGFWGSAYFCFITLSTIGLGDMTPQKSVGTTASTVQLVFCCFYLVIGLAIIAMSFNLVQEQVTIKVTEFAKRIGIIEDK